MLPWLSQSPLTFCSIHICCCEIQFHMMWQPSLPGSYSLSLAGPSTCQWAPLLFLKLVPWPASSASIVQNQLLLPSSQFASVDY